MEGAIEAEEMSLQKMPMICEDSCEKSSEMSFHVNKKRSGLVYTNINEQDFLDLLFATKNIFGRRGRPHLRAGAQFGHITRLESILFKQAVIKYLIIACS